MESNSGTTESADDLQSHSSFVRTFRRQVFQFRSTLRVFDVRYLNKTGQQSPCQVPICRDILNTELINHESLNIYSLGRIFALVSLNFDDLVTDDLIFKIRTSSLCLLNDPALIFFADK